MNATRLPSQEIGERGSRIYRARLPELLQAGARGLFVAIDILSEEYEVADEARVASERLKARNPGAQILVERIGFPAAFTALSSRVSHVE